LFAGCEPPGEVEVRTGNEGIEVTSLLLADTSFGLSAIDTSALLPLDQIDFSGSFLVNHVRHDDGEGVMTFSVSRAIVTDRSRPVQGHGGKVVGYHGFFLGSLFLNDDQMTLRAHLIPTVDSLTVAGSEYGTPPGFMYVPGTTYTWTADTISTAAVSIEAPALISVYAPLGGDIIDRNRDLEIRWSSDGEVNIIISRLGRFGRRHPTLHIHPLGQTSAIVPSRVLQLLLPEETYFFTFVRANRKEIEIGRGTLSGTVVVQAASVYNSVVQIR
jgi:hypothetical protein